MVLHFIICISSSDSISIVPHDLMLLSLLSNCIHVVAKDCHKKDSANSDRDGVVLKIREAGFRVEGTLLPL